MSYQASYQGLFFPTQICLAWFICERKKDTANPHSTQFLCMKDFVILHGHCSVDCSLLLKQSKWKTEQANSVQCFWSFISIVFRWISGMYSCIFWLLLAWMQNCSGLSLSVRLSAWQVCLGCAKLGPGVECCYLQLLGCTLAF